MEEQNGHNSPSRLDRVEAIIEALANRQHLIEDEFARLLRAQVVTVDEVEKLKALNQRTDQKFQEMAEAHRRLDEAVSVLVVTVDGFIRDRKDAVEQLQQRTEELSQRTDQKFQELAGQFQELAEAQQRQFHELAEAQQRQFQELAEAQRRLDETVGVLVVTVDGFIRGRKPE